MPVKKKTELEQLITDIHTFQINYHTRELYLNSSHNGNYEDGEQGVEYRMATSFVKNVHLLAGQAPEAPILVHMHSIGGEWNDGMAIFDTMRFSPTPITVIAYAQASSMSGVILQGADYRVMSPDCEFMMHHGSISVSDNSLAAKSAIDVNEKLCKRMIEIFARRAKVGAFFADRGYSENKIKAFFNRKLKEKVDWYLDAEEAKYYGLCDGILGEKDHETYEILKVYEKFKKRI